MGSRTSQGGVGKCSGKSEGGKGAPVHQANQAHPHPTHRIRLLLTHQRHPIHPIQVQIAEARRAHFRKRSGDMNNAGRYGRCNFGQQRKLRTIKSQGHAPIGWDCASTSNRKDTTNPYTWVGTDETTSSYYTCQRTETATCSQGNMEEST